MTIKLFDAHCHLQDPRILDKAPQLISTALDTGILRFAVNGIYEKDWHLVKQMGEQYPYVIPCFGLHPWYIADRTPNWFNLLNEFFRSTPSAAVGEIGLDKGSHGKNIDFTDQVEVFRQQLELAKQLNRPASVHCVRAFGDLLEIMKSMGPFPAGVILHSYLGSAEMVPEFAKLGAYFSFSGFLMSMKVQKAKRMLKAVASDRILLETDAPDAVPNSNTDSLYLVDGDESVPGGTNTSRENSASNADSLSNDNSRASKDASSPPTLNHPANIHNVCRYLLLYAESIIQSFKMIDNFSRLVQVLGYVASLLDMTKEELAETSYRNAVRLFSYEGSKVLEG